MTTPDTLPPELAELGELLREDRPRPDDGWARTMDERMAAGFPERPRPVKARRRRRFSFAALQPALGPAVVLLIVAGVLGAAILRGGAGEFEEGGSGGRATSESSDSAGGGSEAAPLSGEDSGASAGADELARGKQRDAAGGSAGPESQSAPTAGSVPPAPGGGSPGSDARRNRAVERSAALTLGAPAREIGAVADGVVRVTDAVGGFVSSSSVSGSSGGDAYGTFELRVPASRLQRALAELSRLAHVRERSQASRDITAQTVSARDRLQEARRERQSLLRQLGRAITLNETDSIKARLALVNRRISAYRAALKRVTNRASFANVSVQLVADAGPDEADEGGWTPGDAFDDAVRVLEVAVGILLIALAVGLPLGLLAALGWLGSRAVTRRRRDRALDLA